MGYNEPTDAVRKKVFVEDRDISKLEPPLWDPRNAIAAHVDEEYKTSYPIQVSSFLIILANHNFPLLPLPSVRSLTIQNLEICAALRKMENLGSWEKMWQWRWDIVIQEMH